MAGGNQAEFAQQLITALRDGTFTRNANATDRINNFAETVNRLLNDLTNQLDPRGLHQYEVAIEFAENLVENLETAMDGRRNAQVGGVVGTLIRIGGTVAYANPIGQIAFWGGFAVSTISDLLANIRGKEIENFERQLNSIFRRDEDSFRVLARVIQRLDQTIEEATGWSLYSEDFRTFLRNATQNPERVRNLPVCADVNPERMNNLIELARSGEVMRLLTQVTEDISSGNVAYLSAVYNALNAVSFIQSSTTRSAALQVGELAVRGLNLFVDYRRNQATLRDFGDGIARMRRELEALRQIYPDL